MSRIRHCLECPNCRTLYLISRSPYRNGGWIDFTLHGLGEAYILYCSCRSMGIRLKAKEVLICEVSKEAYERGFGSREEVVPLRDDFEEEWPFRKQEDADLWNSRERRSDRR